ncbi:hypothetical protein C6503_11230 [Candidatus Poribacteria bacterium]|nr:MAG: hypothetical protein C6503_11230 [Candidatus Poribacteria bacterium]
MATQKMRRFAVIAQEEALTRNEMLVWLHRSYSGSAKLAHISQKRRIPPRLWRSGLSETGACLEAVVIII